MRLGRTSWIILFIGILIAAGVSLYMLYRGQMGEQEKLDESLSQETATLQLLYLERLSLEGELAQLEIDLAGLQGQASQLEDEMGQLEAELSQLEAEREQAVAQAILLLNEAEAKFFSSVEGIEYGEVLFGFARDANLEVDGIAMSEPTDIDVEGVTYTTTSFTITVQGEVADILSFVDTIVTNEAFRTAILEPFNMEVPEPLTDEEKEDIEETIRAELTAEAEAKLTTEDLVRFMLEAIVEVVGPDYKIEKTMTVEEIAALIKVKIADLLGEDFATLLSQDLAELIEEHIDKSIVEGEIRDKIVTPLAEEIASLIVEKGEGGFLEEDLVELLGEDIAELLGEEIAGLLPGYITGLLRDYIDNLAEEKKADLVAGLVDEELVEELAAEKIEEMEPIPLSDITLVIYTYQGE